MFSFYIRNYLDNGSVQPKETLMYTIPETIDNPMLSGLRFKGDMGKSESFEFALEPSSIWYRKIRQHLTIIRITYDSDTIFFGRVIDVSKDPFGRRSYHCEGALGFLLDSFQSPSKEDKRKETDVLTWLNTIINKHNEQVGENAWKWLTLGEVPGQYTSATLVGQRVENVPNKKYGTDSWQESLSCIEELVTDNGGYLRIRYENQNGEEKLYLDWLKDYFRAWDSTMTPIEVGVNLIEENSKNNINNLFTVLIPYGSKKGDDFHINHLCWPSPGHANVPYIKVPELISEGVYTEEELSLPYYPGSIFRTAIDDYGVVYKVQKFENARTPVELFEFAKDWIKNNYRPDAISITVKALDLHLTGDAANKYKIGDQIVLIYKDSETGLIKSRMFCIMSIQYDFQNPENNTYTLGIPDNPYNKKYGTKQKSGGGGSGGTTPPPPDTEYESVIKKKLDEMQAWYMGQRLIEHANDGSFDPYNFEQTVGEMELPIFQKLNTKEPGGPWNTDVKFIISDIDPIKEEQTAADIARVLRSDGFKTGNINAMSALFDKIALGGRNLHVTKIVDGQGNEIEVVTPEGEDPI